MKKGIRFEIDLEKLMRNKDLVRKEFLENPDLLLPRRAKKGSAGYDLKYPYNKSIILNPGDNFIVESFVKIIMPEGYRADMYVRSSLGIKKNIVLSNGTGIIDSDYKDTIKIPLINIGTKEQSILTSADTRIVQIVFNKYEITDDDDADGIRTGGIGSTDSK